MVVITQPTFGVPIKNHQSFRWCLEQLLQQYYMGYQINSQGIKLYRVPLDETETGGHWALEEFYSRHLEGTRLCGFRGIWQSLEPLPYFDKVHGVPIGGEDLNHRVWTPAAFEALHAMVDEAEVRTGMLGTCSALLFNLTDWIHPSMVNTNSVNILKEH